MDQLGEWRPIWLSKRLGRRPIAVSVFDATWVLFRTSSGVAGVLPERCPHRGMRLSRGAVEGESLVCPYHGWSFKPDGAGFCPASPKLAVSAGALELREELGLIWVKRPGAGAPFPELGREGYFHIHSAVYPVKAPVELLLDNFTEVEHTGIAHWQFGYDHARIGEVENTTEIDENAIRVKTRGPQKKLSFVTRWALGVKPGDHLHCEWETHCSPLRTIWEWWWTSPSGQARPVRHRAIAYLNRVSENESQLVTYYFWTKPPARIGLQPLMLPFVRWFTEYELRRDRWLVENIVHGDRERLGRRLGRFDLALAEQRKQLGRLPVISDGPRPAEQRVEPAVTDLDR